MSNHVLIRLIRFVSRFTVYLCNAIYFSTTFSILCKRFIKILDFAFWDLNRAIICAFILYSPRCCSCWNRAAPPKIWSGGSLISRCHLQTCHANLFLLFLFHRMRRKISQDAAIIFLSLSNVWYRSSIRTI